MRRPRLLPAWLISLSLALPLHACGSASSPAASPSPVVASSRSTAELPESCPCPAGSEACAAEARSYELGASRERDYAEAARFWQCGCDGGDGDAEACLRWARYLSSAWGVAMDQAAATRIVDDLCARGDAAACVDRFLLGDQKPGVPDDRLVRAARAEAERGCDGGDMRACAGYVFLTYSFRRDQLGDVDRFVSRAERACASGELRACLALRWFARDAMAILIEDCDGQNLAGTSCLEFLKAQSSGPLRRMRELRATSRVGFTAACEEGDLVACSATELRKRDDAARCRAHDWQSCAYWPSAGAAALEEACEHRVPYACRRLGIAARDTGEPDPERARSFFEKACALGDEEACQFVGDTELGAGCMALERLEAGPGPIATLRGRVDGRETTHTISEPTVIVAWAPWFPGMSLDDIAGFASLLDVPVVVLASVGPNDEVGSARGLPVLTDRADSDQVVGRQTRELGIEKVPEIVVVDEQGTPLERVVATEFGAHHERCIEQALAR